MSTDMEFPRSKRDGETRGEYESELLKIVHQSVSREFPDDQTVEATAIPAAKPQTATTSSPANSTSETFLTCVKTSCWKLLRKYKKRSGVADGAGESYECKMLTLVFLRMLASVYEFQLASNMEAAGAFDDIVMRYRKQSSDLGRIYCVQLKHKQDKAKVIPKKEFLNVIGDFSLVKYCASFASIKSSVSKELQWSDEQLLILYTNANIVQEDLVDEVDSDALLCTGGKVVSFKPGGEVCRELCEWVDFKDILVKLNDDLAGLSDEEVGNRIQVALKSADYNNKAVTSWNSELLKTPTLGKLKELLKKLEPVSDKETYSSFLAEFQMYTGQAHESELDAKIEEELVRVWRSCNDLESEKMFNELLGEVQSWWKKGNHYLTQDSPLWLDIIKSQVGILSKGTIEGLTKTGVKFEERSLQDLHDKISHSEGICHLRVDSETAASSLRVHQALALTEDLIVLHVNMKALLAREDHLLSAWATRWCPVLVVECDDELDRKQATRVCEKILKEVGRKNDTKLLVLISRKKHEVNVQLKYCESYTSFHDNCNWNDLTEDTKTNIFLESVEMNGSPSKAPLSYLVGRDRGFLNKVNLEVISQFISGDFHFGKDLGQESTYFVTRRLINSVDGKSFVVNSVHDVPGKVVLVVAEPGMGKSTLFAHLAQSAKKDDPSAWVVLIRLNDCVQFLKSVDVEHFNEFEAKIFLEHVALNSGNSLEKLLFVCLKNKLVVFVDGVDEVCPHYATQVFKLLSALRDMAFTKLYVASRPVVRENLENILNVKTHLLEAFSKANQSEFFNKVRKLQNLLATHEECNIWTQSLLRWLTESLGEDNPILGVPLMNVIIAETFQGRLFLEIDENGSFKPSERLDLMSLYENFVEKKFDLYCVEKKKTLNRDQPAELDVEKKLKEQMHHNHRLAALRVLFSQEEISSMQFDGKKRFIEDLATYLKEVSDGTEKIGIIDNVVDGVPHFVHRSFAEFFVASWLASCFEKNNEFLKRALFDTGYSFIAEMFHWTLAGNRPQHLAVLKRDVKATKSFLTGKTPSDVNEQDAGGRTPLHLASILSGTDQHPDCIHILELLLQDKKVRLDVRDKVFGWVPLQYAEMSRAWKTIEIIFKSGKNSVKQMKDRPKPDPHVMLDAARDAPLSVVRYMVEAHGGKVDCRGPEGETIVHIAAKREDVDVLVYLANKKLPLDTKDHQGNTALHCASQHCVRYLLAHGLRPDAVNKEGLTALQVTALNGEYDKVAALLDANVSFKPKFYNATEKQLNACLLCAAFAGSLESVKKLNKKGASEDCQDKNGHTAAWVAMYRGNIEVMNWLLQLGGSKHGDALLHVACRRSELEIVSFILSRGADIDGRGWCGQTPLIAAAGQGNLTLVELLLKKGANVEGRDKKGNTALHVALLWRREQVASLLIRYGADVNAVNHKGETMLHKSASGNNLAVAEVLLELGADVECRETEGDTALHLALREGSEQVADLLLRHGADVNAVNKEGKTMLHRAAWSNNLTVATLLLKKGANVECRDVEGKTALHFASRWGSKQVAALLLRYGADVTAEDNSERTPLSLATQSDHSEMVALFEAAVARTS